MERGTDSLRYAVRAAVLRYYLCRLAAAVAILTLVPAGASLALGELRLAGTLTAIAVLLALSWVSSLRLRPPNRLQTNEALVIVALAFVATSLLMAVPFAVGGFSFPDALFESVSGVTTTGLSIVERVADMNPGLLFLRSWLQWYGGLGIAAFSLALLLGHPVGARRLAGLDTADDLQSSARTYAHPVTASTGSLPAAKRAAPNRSSTSSSTCRRCSFRRSRPAASPATTTASPAWPRRHRDG